MAELSFKQAETAEEFQQIQALNHLVFAEEVGQHPRHSSRLLIDPFRHQSFYYVALLDEAVVGMICVNRGPQFSIGKRLPDRALIQRFECPLEIRLLAIHPQHRNRTILAGLFWQVYRFAVSNRFSHLLISGISTKLPMYRKLGFTALGPGVRDGAAEFIPMAVAVTILPECLHARAPRYELHWRKLAASKNPVSLMPGPVAIHPRIARAFNTFPESHRSAHFIDVYRKTTLLLNGLSSGLEAVLFPGTGTLANDAVAANLKAIYGARPGLVITNGEFGERLAKQATGAGLLFRTIRFRWGQTWDFNRIEQAMGRNPGWVWAVQLETSTGVLNDTETLLSVAARHGAVLALDCVSSIGATRISDARKPFLATGVSGKSIGAYTGLAFVYLSEECRRMLVNKMLCPSFELLATHRTRKPSCTMSSSLLFALSRALEDYYHSPEAIAQRYARYLSLGTQVRREMQTMRLYQLAAEFEAAPNITTFPLPDPLFPEKCLELGYRIAHESPYLSARRWGQIATMGDINTSSLLAFFDALRHRNNGRHLEG